MRARQLTAVAVILGMCVLAHEAHAHSGSAHGHGGTPQETAQQKQGTMGQGTMGPGLMMPSMDPARGRRLFVSKGCVVCHSVNGIGGKDAPPLDASTMPQMMNPFEFAAKMWRGAEAMIYLQREELGEQIEFTGGDLADIIAYVHHHEQQKKFSEADIPPRIKDLMHHMEEEEPHEDEGAHGADKAKE